MVSQNKEADMATINDNDMEVIMNADQEDVIRDMLNDRLYS